MSGDLVSRYAAPVPRYTSYPTAAPFGPAVDAGVQAAWLDGVRGGSSLSLYLHIPFCDTLCWFCGCHTRVVNRRGPIARHVETPLAEIDLVADRLPRGCRVAHLHFGGGSPTILTPDEIERIGDRLRARFPFDAGAEIGIEIDPRGRAEDVADALADLGVNRASIGVQDFDPQVQAAINRLQGFAGTERAVRLRRDVIERLMCDLRVDLDAVAVRHGRPVGSFEPELAALSAMRADGLVAVSGGVVTVTEAGRPFLRVAAAAFDRYLGGGRHSVAV